MIHGLAILIGFFIVGFIFIMYMSVQIPKDEDSYLELIIPFLVLLISYGIGWGAIAIVNIFS